MPEQELFGGEQLHGGERHSAWDRDGVAGLALEVLVHGSSPVY